MSFTNSTRLRSQTVEVACLLEDVLFVKRCLQVGCLDATVVSLMYNGWHVPAYKMISSAEHFWRGALFGRVFFLM